MNMNIPKKTLVLLLCRTLKVNTSSYLNSTEIHKLDVLLLVVPQNTDSLAMGNTVMD